MELKDQNELFARLAVCAVVAAGAVYAAENLCRGKNYPLWEKYGPWIAANKVQAIAIGAAALYALSLALWPQGKDPDRAAGEEGYTPCP